MATGLTSARHAEATPPAAEHRTRDAPRGRTRGATRVREAARAGRMVTVLPRIAVTSELEEGTLVVRPLSEANLEDTTISLIHRLGRQLDGAPARLLAAFETRIKGWNETETGRD